MKTICVGFNNITGQASIRDYLPSILMSHDTRFVMMDDWNESMHADAIIETYCVNHPSKPFISGVDVMGRPYASFTRLDKVNQQHLLKIYTKELHLSHFMNLITINEVDFNNTILPVENAIIKPAHGARSIGQIVFKPSETQPKAISVQINISANTKELEENLKSNFTNTFYSVGNEQCEDEGFNVLRQSMICQEIVPDVVEEYRIITNESNHPVIVNKRELVTVLGEYKIPSAKPDVCVKNTFFDTHPTVYSELLKLLESDFKIPFHSIDIFITAAGHWGIFEFSPEFDKAEYGPRPLSVHAIGFLNKYLKV